MRKIIDYVVTALEHIVIILFFVIVSTSFLQVFLRYVLSSSISWIHDLDILLMIWAVWLCAPIGLSQKAHLRINFLDGRFPGKVQKVLNLLLHFLTLLFLIMLGIKGIGVIQSVAGMTQLILPIPTGLMFAAAPTGAALMILVFIPDLVEDLKRLTLPEGRRRN